MMRFERKYRITHLNWLQVLDIVRQHPLSFRTAHPDRRINNIYLDTLDLSGFHENLMGISQRRKFRIRWYGDDLLKVHKPILEAKIKDAGLGKKRSAPLEDFEWKGGPELRGIVDLQLQKVRSLAFAEAMADPQQETPPLLPLQGIRPSLINSYHRSYFASMDGRFRLTVDRDLHFYNPDFRIHPERNFATDHAVIVELKYDEADDALYDRVGMRLPFQLSRNSKYVNGILLVGNT